MTLQNFADGGFDVIDAKLLVVVKSIGARRKGMLNLGLGDLVVTSLHVHAVTRKDESTVDNVNLQVHDDTGEATLGLWGTSSLSPFGVSHGMDTGNEDQNEPSIKQPWKPGETVLLLQGPAWKISRTTYLSLTSATIVDVDPIIPDADWLRKWSLRQKSRELVNPPFPEVHFDMENAATGAIRCLFTLAELDEFARAAPNETFHGYLSLIIMEVKLVDSYKRQMLLSGDCCNMPVYANALKAKCKGCDNDVSLRLNPRILGQVLDETGSISSGKLLFADRAWRDLLGRDAGALLKLSSEKMKWLSDRLLFCRISLRFGWPGDESVAGGRICVLGVSS
jgi:hypothetical protein